MKTKFFSRFTRRCAILLIAIAGFISPAQAQPGGTCDSAYTISSGSCDVQQNQSADVWYSFIADGNHQSVQVRSSSDTLQGHAHRVEIYNGSCSALTLIASDEVSSMNDTLLQIDTTLFTTGNSYYIKVITQGPAVCRTCQRPANFTVCKFSGSPPSVTSFDFLPTRTYTACGLKYCLQSIQLNRRNASPAVPAFGNAQPTLLTISCLPASFHLLAARFYFITIGNTPQTITLTVVDPQGNVHLVQASMTGQDITTATCWNGPFNNTTSSYVADFAPIIAANGSGIYAFTGCPDIPASGYDTDGATLLLVYNEACPVGERIGRLLIREGLGLTTGGATQNYTMNGQSFASNINSHFLTVVGDVQTSVVTNQTTINGVVVPGTFWDQIDIPVGINSNQQNFFFTHANNNTHGDCSATPFFGFYMQDGSQYCGLPSLLDAGPDQYVCIGGNNVIQLNAAAVNAGASVIYQWTPFTGLSSPFILNPTATISGDITYTVHAIDSAGCKASDSMTVHFVPPPVVNIVGSQYANCESATFFQYADASCNPTLQYNWTFTPNNSTVPTNFTGCPVNVQVPVTGGILILYAYDPISKCDASDTLYIAGCCLPAPTGYYYLSNTTASAFIQQYGIVNNTVNSLPVVFNGVVDIDVPLTFNACLVGMGQNARINVLPLQTLTFNNCDIGDKCDSIMWDGIYIKDATATLNILNGCEFRWARNCVVSQKGGAFNLRNSDFEDNYKHVVVEPYATTVQCDVRSCRFTYTGSFPLALPPLPPSAIKPYVAFEINQVQQITIGNPGAANYRNIIELCDFGIKAEQSNVAVYNNTFRSIQPNPSIAFSGVCIYDKANKLNPKQLTIGGTAANQPNLFQRYALGVDAFNYINLDVQKNTFDNGANNNGQIGVGAFACSSRSIIIKNNSFTRHQKAIWINDCLNADADIQSNTITAPAFGATGTGIQVDAAIPYMPMTLNIRSNTIDKTRTGVYLINITGSISQPQPSVRYNNVTMNFTNPQIIANGIHYGIRVTNTSKVDVEANFVTRAQLPTVQIDTLLRGIHVENAATTRINSNTFERMSDGIWMFASCPGSQITCNVMERCRDAVFLRNATIGNQFGGFASDNRFALNINSPSTSTSSDFRGSVPPTSPTIWYYRNNSSAAYVYTFNFVSGPFFPTVNNALGSGCSPIPPPLPPPVRAARFATALQNQNSLQQTNPEYNWWNKKGIYQHFNSAQPELTLNTADDTLYQAFYSAQAIQNIGLQTSIAQAIARDSVSLAQNLNSSFIPVGTIDQYRKTVTGIYLSSWAIGTRCFSSADSSTLYTIALGNPELWGDAVYSARVMLGLDPTATSGQRLGGDEIEATDETEMVCGKIYPNPAHSEAVLAYRVNENETAVLEIFSVVGQLVQSVMLGEGESHTFLTENLLPGTYIYRVSINGEIHKTDRLVIVE